MRNVSFHTRERVSLHLSFFLLIANHPKKRKRKTLFHSRAAPRRSGGRKGRSDKDEKMFQTHHGATNELSAFLFHREWGYFLFELLQDGVLPPLKCPLCPEGVSLSAAKSDRQSGALKAHTPFCSQPLLRQTPGLRSHTHRHTHTGWVSSVKRARNSSSQVRTLSYTRASCA